MSGNLEEGVYVEEEGGLRRLHRFEFGDYGLEDVAELLHLGTPCTGGQPGWTGLELEGRELHELKVHVDAYGFDFEEGFTEMCLDIVRKCPAAPARVKLWANF